MLAISLRYLLLVIGLIAGSIEAGAQDTAYTPADADGNIVVVLQNHVFSPAEIHIPAGEGAQLLIKNLDATADEFDSSALKIEKVIAGKSSSLVKLRALDKGSYPFVGEYHSQTAKGVVIVQ
jgi:hypothetical protein